MNPTPFTPATDVIAIDFETYYDKECSVTTLGYYAYTHHPKFDAYLVAVTDGKTAWVGHPSRFDWQSIHGKTWLAHNASFDRSVFEWLRDTGKIPPVAPDRWLCTAAMSASLQCPRSLEGATKAILGMTVDKGVRARAEGKQAELLLENRDMEDYARTDAMLCWMIWDKCKDHFPNHEWRLWEITDAMGADGIQFDVGYAKKQLADLCGLVASAAAQVPWGQSGVVASPKALADACTMAGVPPPPSTAEDDPELDAWLHDHSGKDVAGYVRAMQTWRKANRAQKVLETMLARVMGTGRIEAHLKYFGAFTGRWSGGNGLNFQNLNSDTSLVDLRGCLIPAPGHTFAVIDLAQIEARVLLWLAGDSKTLDMIRQGVSVYEAHARRTMGWDGGKLKVEDPRLYRLAKARVLGLGFGCGRNKFKLVAKAMAGLDLTDETAAQTVDDYRESNPGIVKLWADYEAAFKHHHGATFHLDLPSGRYLTYRKVDAHNGVAEQIKNDPPSNIYGGLLVENLVQATARDLFADRLLALVDAGYKPVMLVHDEYVLEVDEATAGQDLKRAMDIIQSPPRWADSLPVECEGSLMDRYAK